MLTSRSVPRGEHFSSQDIPPRSLECIQLALQRGPAAGRPPRAASCKSLEPSYLLLRLPLLAANARQPDVVDFIFGKRASARQTVAAAITMARGLSDIPRSVVVRGDSPGDTRGDTLRITPGGLAGQGPLPAAINWNKRRRASKRRERPESCKLARRGCYSVGPDACSAAECAPRAGQGRSQAVLALRSGCWKGVPPRPDV